MTRETLMAYLIGDLGADPSRLQDDTPLFSGGMLDSFRMIDLMTFIEGATGRQMDPVDVTLDNLDNMTSILAYVARKGRG